MRREQGSCCRAWASGTALIPKALVAAWPHHSAVVQGWLSPLVPSGRHSAMLVPCFGCVHDPAAATSPRCLLPQRQGAAFHRCTGSPAPPHAHQRLHWECRRVPAWQCVTLPETGAPGTAHGMDPCTPAGRSPAARAGSARGSRLGCSCKDRALWWDKRKQPRVVPGEV